MKVHKITLLAIVTLLLFLEGVCTPAFAISNKALGDSLTTYIGFPVVVPRVRVRNLRVNRNIVTLQTNKTLSAASLSPDELETLRKKVSQWILGNTQGKVSIYSDGYELGELITDRFKSRTNKYDLSPRPALEYNHREWDAPNGLDKRNIALWPSHGMYYNSEQDMWRWQRARLWSMVEDLYTYEYIHTWLIPMLENAGAYVIEPRAREGLYYKKDGKWLWLGDRKAPDGAEVKYIGNEPGSIKRGPDSITSGHPKWMEGARYWLQYTGFPDSIYNPNKDANDYKDDLQCRGLWVNYLSGGSRANPNQPGLGIQIDACMALHTDGFTAEKDEEYIGTLVIYTDHDDHNHKTFPTGTSRIVNRDFADYVQTQVVNDIRQQYAPTWTRRELNNSAYCESRYPVVPSILLEVLSHKNIADIQCGLDPNFQMLYSRAIYKGLGRWLQGDDFVVQPLPVHGLNCFVQDSTCRLQWAETPDTLEPSAQADYYLVNIQTTHSTKAMRAKDSTFVTRKTEYSFPCKKGYIYSIHVEACNKGGKSLPSAPVMAYITDQHFNKQLMINNFRTTSGPKWFVDSERAGIVPGSYAIPQGTSYSYLGDQWIFEKQRKVKDNGWVDDDNCGWGMCHMDYVGKELIGNDPARLLKQAQDTAKLHHNIILTNADGLCPEDTTSYNLLYIHCGQERGSLYSTTLRNLIEKTIVNGGDIIIEGRFLGSGITDTAERKWAEKNLGYTLKAPNATQELGGLKTNAPDAISPTLGGKIIERFADTGLPSTIRTKRGKSTITIISK